MPAAMPEGLLRWRGLAGVRCERPSHRSGAHSHLGRVTLRRTLSLALTSEGASVHESKGQPLSRTATLATIAMGLALVMMTACGETPGQRAVTGGAIGAGRRRSRSGHREHGRRRDGRQTWWRSGRSRDDATLNECRQISRLVLKRRRLAWDRRRLRLPLSPPCDSG
jgi:hypothetical protein